jgi:hypothetical protein
LDVFLDVKKGVSFLKYLGIPIHFRNLNNIDWRRLKNGLKKDSVVGK